MPSPPLPADAKFTYASDLCCDEDIAEASIPMLPSTAPSAGLKKHTAGGVLPCGADGQPLLYPAPLLIRNTFIDVVSGRSPSMDEFWVDRMAISCPTSKLTEFGSGCEGVRERAIGLNIRGDHNVQALGRRDGGDDEQEDVSSDSSSADVVLGSYPRRLEMMGPSVTGADGQPLVYPVPVFVRNTFIDVGTSKPGCLVERQAVSCPTSKLSEVGSDCEEARERTIGLNVRVGKTLGLDLSACGRLCEQEDDSACSTADTGDYQGEGLCIFQTADMMDQREQNEAVTPPELVVGSPDCPTIGSSGHATGNCKPCAFFHTKACGSGPDCEFCHLCEVGEKKKRQKEKRQFFGMMKAMERAAWAGLEDMENAEELAAAQATTGDQVDASGYLEDVRIAGLGVQLPQPQFYVPSAYQEGMFVAPR